MFKRLAIAAIFTLGAAGAIGAPAQAASLVQNGDFTGAKNITSDPNVPGPPVPTPFGVGSSSYFFKDFSWYGTGSGALNAIAANVAQIPNLYGPANPAGYMGNIYVADANPSYSGGVFLLQNITGLTVGTNYTLTFKQASGSYYPGILDSAQWDVGFGGSVAYDGSTFVLSDASHQYSDLMTNGIGGYTDWTTQSLTFTAKDNSQLLSFFALGTGAPPFALLADVSLSASVPEPATWFMMIAGFGLVGVTMRRRAADRRAPVPV